MLGIGIAKIINQVEAELTLHEQAGAFAWADKNGETRWARAMEHFDFALVNSKDPAFVKKAAEEYRDALIDLFKRYKKSRQVDEVQLYLENLKARRGK